MKQSRTKLARLIAERTLRDGTSRVFEKEVAAYLLSERRVNELDSVLRDVRADWAAAGYVEVIANSAHTLTASLKAEIARHVRRFYPQAKRVIITEAHDPSALGGVQLKLADQQLDLTVRSKLNKFKRQAAVGRR